MEKLSPKKHLTVIRLYLGGLSYQEISAKAGVSKGTVANIVAALKVGQFPEAQESAEQLEMLRELATDLHHLKLTPAQAVAGLAALSRLHDLGVEPTEIQSWAAMCKHLMSDETDAQNFVKAALYLEELRKSSGLTVQALEKKAQSLRKEVEHLEPLSEELKSCQQQLEELEKKRQQLCEEISHLEKRHGPLSKDVSQKEKSEAELSHRVQELEQRAQAADERLAAARNDLKALAELGLSPEEITGFVQRIAAVAQQQSIKPKALRDRLLYELEQLKAGLGLESLVQAKKSELDKTNDAIAKAQHEQVAIDSALHQLRQQQASLHAAIAEEEKQLRKKMQAIVKTTQNAESKLKKDLEKGVRGAVLEVETLRDQAFNLGQELGHCEAIVEANEWITTLAALVKGDGDIGTGEVRAAGLTVLRALDAWLRQHQGTISHHYPLKMYLDSAIKELEQWKV